MYHYFGDTQISLQHSLGQESSMPRVGSIRLQQHSLQYVIFNQQMTALSLRYDSGSEMTYTSLLTLYLRSKSASGAIHFTGSRPQHNQHTHVRHHHTASLAMTSCCSNNNYYYYHCYNNSRYFFQRISVLIQRYNSILFRETFPAEGEIDVQPFQPGFSFFQFLTRRSILIWLK